MALMLEVSVINSKSRILATRWMVRFCLERLVSPRLMDSLFVEVEYQDGFYEENGHTGSTTWTDDPYRPKEFSINLDPALKPMQIVRTLAHECAHVRQFAVGDLVDLVKRPDVVRWKDTYYIKKLWFNEPFLNRAPWEKEANRIERVLFWEYKRCRGLLPIDVGLELGYTGKQDEA